MAWSLCPTLLSGAVPHCFQQTLGPDINCPEAANLILPGWLNLTLPGWLRHTGSLLTYRAGSQAAAAGTKPRRCHAVSDGPASTYCPCGHATGTGFAGVQVAAWAVGPLSTGHSNPAYVAVTCAAQPATMEASGSVCYAPHAGCKSRHFQMIQPQAAAC